MGRSGQGLVTNVCASRLPGPEQRWFWLSSENGGVADLKKKENISQLSRESIRSSKELFGWWKACQSLWMKLKISHRCVVLVGAGRGAEGVSNVGPRRGGSPVSSAGRSPCLGPGALPPGCVWVQSVRTTEREGLGEPGGLAPTAQGGSGLHVERPVAAN